MRRVARAGGVAAAAAWDYAAQVCGLIWADRSDGDENENADPAGLSGGV
jgi:hypothetical protein